MIPQLVFGDANAKLKALQSKLGRKLYTFSVMSGYTCPYAKDCLSKAVFNGNSWTIIDGPDIQYRCFSASQEVIFPSVRASRINNMRLIELAAIDVNKAIEAININIPKDCNVLRLHVGGDFKTQAYFDTWLEFARLNPSLLIYAYTKSLPFWVRRIDELPVNFVLTASRGGYKDALINQHNLRESIVVNPMIPGHKIIDANYASVDDVVYEIDHDDSHAASVGPSFALVIHGIQPKGTIASEGLKKLDGFGTYNQKTGANTVYA